MKNIHYLSKYFDIHLAIQGGAPPPVINAEMIGLLQIDW